MPSRNTIEIIVQGEDNASRVLSGVSQKLDDIGKLAVGVVVGGLATASAAIAGFGVKSIAEFAEFEKGMAETFKLLPDLSKEAMLQMEEDVQRLAARYGQLPTEVAAGMASAIGAGVDVSQINAFMDTAAQAAVAGSTDIQTAVDGLTSVVNAYGAEVIDAARASDIMFKTVDLGKVEFSELSRYLFNVIPTAASLGLAFEDVGAAISLLTAQGTPASVATTQIRQLLVELQKPTTKVSQLFEKMAGVSFPQFIKQGGNLSEALDMIRKGADDSGMELAAVFGSVEALNAFLGLSGPNAEKYAGFIAEMGDSAGSTARAFEVMQKTISFQSARMQAKLSNLFINIGRTFEPIAAKVLEQVGDIVSVFDAFLTGDMTEGADFTGIAGALFDALKPIKPLMDSIRTEVMRFFEAIGAGVPFFDALITTINNILPPDLQEGFANFIGLIKEIGRVVGEILDPIIKWVQENIKLQDVLIPLGIAIAGVVIPAVVGLIASLAGFLAPIALIVGAVALLRKAWETDFLGIRTFILDKVIPALQKLADWFLSTALPAIINFIQTEAIPFFERIGTTIEQIWTLVRPGLEKLADWFINTALPSIVTFIRDTALPLIENFINTIANIWSTVGTALGQFLEWFILTGLPVAQGFIEDAWQAIQDLIGILQLIWQNVQTPLNNLLSGIRNIFNQIKNNIIQPIIDKINEFAGTIRNILEQLGLVQSQAQITQTALNNVANHPNRAITNSPELFGRANGMEFVPFNQNVRVHRGEAILTAEQNEARLNGEMGQVNNTFTIQINAPMTKTQADETANNMINALRNRGIQLSRA